MFSIADPAALPSAVWQVTPQSSPGSEQGGTGQGSLMAGAV